MTITDFDNKLPENYVELARLDESADYEVDVTVIVYNKKSKKFLLGTASGCSCWDGDWNSEEFNSLKGIEASLLKDEREYNPSFKGTLEIIKQAKATFDKLK